MELKKLLVIAACFLLAPAWGNLSPATAQQKTGSYESVISNKPLTILPVYRFQL